MADVELIDFTIPTGPGHVLYLPTVPGIIAVPSKFENGGDFIKISAS
jgi:hypothetical protein